MYRLASAVAFVTAGLVVAQAHAQGGLGGSPVRPQQGVAQLISPIPPGVGDAQVAIAWWNVLLLVNANSPAGLEIVRLYREYHPEILDEQIVYLDGLVDCASLTASPADEIITRGDFEAHIAEPTRAHLRAFGLQDRVYVIITTAGMPYRIEDTDPALADVIKPAASHSGLTMANRDDVNAATVESELSTLFLIDPAVTGTALMPINGRVVNPYLGYHCSIKKWAQERSMLGRRGTFRWSIMWRVSLSPKIEGDFDAAGWSARNRRMSPGDLYLTARLDGPRPQGKYPVFAVRNMLERAARASDPLHERFVGYNAQQAVIAIDHSPAPPAPTVFASTDMYNMPVALNLLGHDDHPVPPGAEEVTARKFANHYFKLFEFLTGHSATAGATGKRPVNGLLGGTALWDDTATVLSSNHIEAPQGIIGLMTYGCNGGDGRPSSYLLTRGPGGEALFRCAPGAVFVSLESFNAITFFRNATTYQAKIGDFIEMGGTAAAGHAFEPEVSAAFNVEYLYSNLLRDEDQDGVGDLSLAEAVFSSQPYLSWSEVLIGDPLMRLHAGPGEVVNISPQAGDVDEDGIVGYADVLAVLNAFGWRLGQSEYNVMADCDEDGNVGESDLELVLEHYGPGL